MLWGSTSRPAGDISERQCQSVAFSDAGAGASSLLSGTYCFLGGKGVWNKLQNGTCCPHESLTFVINGRRKQLQNVRKYLSQALNTSILQSREITRILLPYRLNLNTLGPPVSFNSLYRKTPWKNPVLGFPYLFPAVGFLQLPATSHCRRQLRGWHGQTR